MPDGDGTTLGVDALLVDAEGADGVEGLRGEGFVDLEDVDVGDAEAGLLEHGGDGEGGADTHQVRRNWRTIS